MTPYVIVIAWKQNHVTYTMKNLQKHNPDIKITETKSYKMLYWNVIIDFIIKIRKKMHKNHYFITIFVQKSL